MEVDGHRTKHIKQKISSLLSSVRGQGGPDVSDILVDHLYGDLLQTDPTIVRQSRIIAKKRFSEIAQSLVYVFESIPASMRGDGYIDAKRRAGVLASYPDVLRRHPHQWPKSDLVKYAWELQEYLSRVERGAQRPFEKNNPALLDAWGDPEKIILPSNPPLHFTGIALREMFQPLRIIYQSLDAVVTRLCVPQFKWRNAFVTNVQRILHTRSVKSGNIADALIRNLSNNITSAYFGALNIEPFTINVAEAVSLCSPGDTAQASAMLSDVSSLLKADNPIIQQGREILGADTISAISGAMKECEDQLE